MLLLIVAAAAGCAGDGAEGEASTLEPSFQEQVTVDPEAGTGVTRLACGRPLPPLATGELTLTGHFPATAASGDQLVTGTVEVTSTVAVRGVVAPRAEAFLVREGRVVTLPVPQDAVGVEWDLAAGEVNDLPGEAALMSCEDAAAVQSRDQRALPPGTYELYARVVLSPDDGPARESFGGPWPLEVR